MFHAQRLRPKVPVVYNPARVCERPILSVNPVREIPDEEKEDGSVSFAGANAENLFDSQDIQFGTEADDSILNFGNSIGREENSHQESEPVLDVKPVLDDADVAALDELFNEQSIDSLDLNGTNRSTLSSERPALNDSPFMDNTPELGQPLLSSTPLENVLPNATTVAKDKIEHAKCNDTIGQTLVRNVTGEIELSVELTDEERIEVHKTQILDKATQNLISRGKKIVVDDELEYIFDPEDKLLPIRSEPVYQTKANDLLSGNVPFKENV